MPFSFKFHGVGARTCTLFALTLALWSAPAVRADITGLDGANCTLAQFAALAQEVDAACCPSSAKCAKSSSMALPQNCSAECAIAYMPFYKRCQRTVDATFDVMPLYNDTVRDNKAAAFFSFYASCSKLDIASLFARIGALQKQGCKVPVDQIMSKGLPATLPPAGCKNDNVAMMKKSGQTCDQVKALGICTTMHMLGAGDLCPCSCPVASTPSNCVDKHSSCPALKRKLDDGGFSCFTDDMGQITTNSTLSGQHLVDQCCASCHTHAQATAGPPGHANLYRRLGTATQHGIDAPAPPTSQTERATVAVVGDVDAATHTLSARRRAFGASVSENCVDFHPTLLNVTRACCNGVSCTNIPEDCNYECATRVPAFFAACDNTIHTTLGDAKYGRFKALVRTCARMPVESLVAAISASPCIAGQVGHGGTAGRGPCGKQLKALRAEARTTTTRMLQEQQSTFAANMSTLRSSMQQLQHSAASMQSEHSELLSQFKALASRTSALEAERKAQGQGGASSNMSKLIKRVQTLEASSAMVSLTTLTQQMRGQQNAIKALQTKQQHDGTTIAGLVSQLAAAVRNTSTVGVKFKALASRTSALEAARKAQGQGGASSNMRGSGAY